MVAFLHAISGLSLALFVVFTLATYAITSGLSMMYIFTNHSLNPVSHETDPLGGCPTVVVPAWMDRWHSWFSHHTEYHLFPTVRPRYYPLVSEWLRQHHGSSYQRITLLEAWRRLWQSKAFEADP